MATASPSATYGTSAVKNRVRVGGALGSNQYYYITNASTGKIDVYRYEKASDGVVATTSIGSVPQGGKFTPNSHASSAEKTHYSSSRAIGKVRQQALQIANREWDGRTQPPPSQAIYGTDSGNIGYAPPGSSTADTSVRGVQGTGYSTDSSTGFSDIAKSLLKNSIRDLGSRGLKNILGGGNRVFVYPTTLRRSGDAQDYIKIDKLKYAPKNRDGYTWSDRSAPSTRIEGSVILPIPGGISDSNSVSWNQDKMGPVETAMANLALTGIEGGFEDMFNKAGAIGKDLSSNKGDVKKAISTAMAGAASGTGAQLLTRTEGAIVNPNMELLFKDPSLRPFNFTWKFAARNQSEADTIIRIIHFFKQGMAPQTTGSNLFLKSPHTWKLTYKHKGRTHRFLNKFKECAMTSLTTAYTPDGNYATFETGHMVAYQITMGLTELEPVFSSDYRDNATEIGY